MSVKLRNDRSEADTRGGGGPWPHATGRAANLFIWPRRKHGQNPESESPENTDLVVCNCPNGWRQSQDRIRIWSGSPGAALATSFAPNLSHSLLSGPVAARSRSPGSHVILMSATVSTLQFFFQLAFLAVWGCSCLWRWGQLVDTFCAFALWHVLWQFPELVEWRGEARGRHLEWLGTVQICGTVRRRHQIDFYLNKV